jgi:hypothetical protein
MYTSGAPQELAGIKHALKLELFLAALARPSNCDSRRHEPGPDFTAAPDFAMMLTQDIATLRLNLYSTGHDSQAEVRRDVLALGAGCTLSSLDAQAASGAGHT